MLDIVTIVAVVVGLSFGAVELRQLRNAQEAQAVLQLFQTVQTPEYIRGSSLIRALPDSLSVEALRGLMRGPDGDVLQQVRLTYEGLGVMVYRGDVSIEWVDELFRFMTLTTWQKFEPLTRADRESTGYPGLFEWHQWLAERLEERGGLIGSAPAYEAYQNWRAPR